MATFVWSGEGDPSKFFDGRNWVGGKAPDRPTVLKRIRGWLKGEPAVPQVDCLFVPADSKQLGKSHGPITSPPASNAGCRESSSQATQTPRSVY